MTPVALGLWLAAFSALTTAFAHASIKAGRDKLAVQAWVRLVGLALATPVAIVTGLPPDYLWPWLIAAAATHAVYQLVLSFSYRVSDFSVAYPIARGIAPILTALAGVLLSRHGFAAAMATGVLTTAYSVLDAKGMRLSPDLLTFVAWFFVLDGLAMPLVFAARRGSGMGAAFLADWRPGLGAAVMSPISFVPALYAFALAPVGAVAAIREASVLIGMLVAGRFLGEKVDTRRLAGAALITVGITGIIATSGR